MAWSGFAVPDRGRVGEHDLFGRAITASVGRVRDCARQEFSSPPAAGDCKRVAAAIQDVLLETADGRGNEIRAIGVRTESDQVPSVAIGAGNAMANSGGHGLSTE